jgi:molecular chaperone GrpE (heat shock protein)
MLDREATTLPKWPFLAGDVLLLAVAAGIGWQFRPPSQLHLIAIIACVVTGAFIAVLPFVLEHRAKLRLGEVRQVASIGDHMTQLRSFTNQITFATAQWQVAQEHADKTVTTARDISERIAHEASAFSEFLKRADQSEKRQLHLELEKMRKAESEWLQVTVRLLDHVFLLHQAALQSGQPRLIEELGRFQHACRDTVRRIGLIPFEPAAEEPFNEALHQLNDSEAKPSNGATVQRTLAPGFRYQGQVLRPALVSLTGNGEPESPSPS